MNESAATNLYSIVDVPLDDSSLPRMYARTTCRKKLHAWPEHAVVRKTGGGKLQRTCLECLKVSYAADQERKKKKYATKEYRRTLSFYRYNLTAEQYDAMVLASEGRCSICKRISEDLHIDHDHACCPTTAASTKRSCGKCVRGLLCERCNFGLGAFQDNVKVLLEAVSYLESRPI